MNDRNAFKARTLIAVTAALCLGLHAGVSRAGGHASPVPPDQEIEVLDPNADPMSHPAVELEPNACDDNLHVNIPPVVLVHRYYYTGDRSFQGPMLPGGPTVLVVNHPRNGERCYINVTMLPGAPKVHYCGSSIDYDYGHNGITIKFGWFGKPKVVYRNGTRVTTQIAAATVWVASGTAALVKQTGIPDRVSNLARNSKNGVVGAAQGINSLTTAVVDPVKHLAQMTPIGGILAPSPENLAAENRDRQVQRAADQSIRDEASINSNH